MGLLEIFHQNIFKWKICLSIKAKLFCVKLRPISQQGFRVWQEAWRFIWEIFGQCLLEAVTVEPCDPILLQQLGLPCELHFSQSTMVLRLPWCVALSQQERGPCCTMRDVGKPGMLAHREGQGHKAYQLQLPWGSISELKWRALGQIFSLFCEISIFSTGKENKNTLIIIIILK